jgi:DsbC/DsbD-like thiol-disulfide interchange protein
MPRILLSCVLVSWTAVCFAGESKPAIVTARTLLATNGAHPGSTVQGAVVAQITSGYHINDHKPSLEYLIPTELKLEANPQVTVQDIDYPRGKTIKFSFEDTSLSVYQGTLVIKVRLLIARATPTGVYSLKGKLAYQACNDSACFPPTSVPVEYTVRVVGAGVTVKRVNEDVFKSGKPM